MAFKNYRNGNYVVYFNTENGTKIRNTHADSFKPDFAENCDVTITNCCDGACSFCYAGCTPNGKHGNLNYPFLNRLHPHTEFAINGNDLSHPDLLPFLNRMKQQEVIVNITVNQKHFEQYFKMLQDLQAQSLIHGIGVSLVNPTNHFLDLLKKSKNTIVHVINGIFTERDAIRLANQDLDILILGYKTTCRGQSFLDAHFDTVSENQKWLSNNIQNLFGTFRTVEFDNLALDQLSIQQKVSEELWERHFMGDDGDFTFFINLVEGYFARNSTSDIHYPILDNIDDMFQIIQQEKEVEYV